MHHCHVHAAGINHKNLPRSVKDDDTADTPRVVPVFSIALCSAIIYETGLTVFSSAEVVDEESVWASVIFSPANLTLVLLDLCFFGLLFILQRCFLGKR